jgi:uncharacterized protein YbjT (DUF2867 family)
LSLPQVTNAFGHVLEEKLVAEKHLRASGLDYTIVRPGGLKSDPPAGSLYVSWGAKGARVGGVRVGGGRVEALLPLGTTAWVGGAI